MSQDMQRIVIVGATSAIATHVARRFAERHAHLVLVARNEEHLRAVAEDLKVRGVSAVDLYVADLRMKAAHQDLVERSVAILGTVDAVVIAHGVLPDQAECDEDVDKAIDTLMTNALSAVSIMQRFALVMKEQGNGVLAVISSVAGERGRPSNYTYGAAKALVTQYASGLRARLRDSGVHVLTVKPGFVDTPMTAHLPKNILFAAPSHVADAIVRGMRHRTPVIYVPWFWRPIMAIVRAIPERLFMRLKS